jgi:hypothetical protein
MTLGITIWGRVLYVEAEYYMLRHSSTNSVIAVLVCMNGVFLLKGPVADATDAPQPWKLIVQLNFNGAPVEWNWQGNTEVRGEKPVPVPLCPPQIPGSNPDLRGERPATNRLSHGTAIWMVNYFLSHMTAFEHLNHLLWLVKKKAHLSTLSNYIRFWKSEHWLTGAFHRTSNFRAGRPRERGLIPSWGERESSGLHSVQNVFGVHSGLLGGGGNLTSHLHVVLTLRKLGTGILSLLTQDSLLFTLFYYGIYVNKTMYKLVSFR